MIFFAELARIEFPTWAFLHEFSDLGVYAPLTRSVALIRRMCKAAPKFLRDFLLVCKRRSFNLMQFTNKTVNVVL